MIKFDITALEELEERFSNRHGDFFKKIKPEARAFKKNFLFCLGDELIAWVIKQLPANSPRRTKANFMLSIKSGFGVKATISVYSLDHRLNIFNQGWKSFDMRYSFLVKGGDRGQQPVKKMKQKVNVTYSNYDSSGVVRRRVDPGGNKTTYNRYKVLHSARGKFDYGSQTKKISLVGGGGYKNWQHEFKGWDLQSQLTMSEIQDMVNSAWEKAERSSS